MTEVSRLRKNMWHPSMGGEQYVSSVVLSIKINKTKLVKLPPSPLERETNTICINIK